MSAVCDGAGPRSGIGPDSGSGAVLGGAATAAVRAPPAPVVLSRAITSPSGTVSPAATTISSRVPSASAS